MFEWATNAFHYFDSFGTANRASATNVARRLHPLLTANKNGTCRLHFTCVCMRVLSFAFFFHSYLL